MATHKSVSGKERTARKSARVSESVLAQTIYIETSALLAALLEGDPAAMRAMRTPGRRVTSALTFAEANRALTRARTTGRLSATEERAAIHGLQTFARRCEIIAVSDDVLLRAGRAFPVEPIRTLDAIHIATVELLGEPPPMVVLVTRDKGVADNARVAGYSIA